MGLGSDPYPNMEFAEQTGVSYSELDVVLAESDVLILTAPLTPEIHHLIAGDAIEA